MGGGEVRFGGRIGIRAGTLESYNLTAVGRDMRIRYPEGFRSQVDTDLALRGPVGAPVLTGTVHVKDALFIKSVDTEGTGLFGLAASAGAGHGDADDGAVRLPAALRPEDRRAVGAAHRQPVGAPRLERRPDAARHLRSAVAASAAPTSSAASCCSRATATWSPAAPSSSPTRRASIRSSTSRPRRAPARPGQTYRVTFRASGTRDRFAWDFSSDPPLSTVDILAMLFGDLRDPRDAELSALRLRDRTEEELLVARATRLLANPISSEVGKVVRKTFGVDTVQITPSLGDLSNLQSARLSPTARLTIGKRLSDRLFLTYAQPLTSARPEQLLLIEYNQSDRFAWILSRNEDETYAIDVRVRHVF